MDQGRSVIADQPILSFAYAVLTYRLSSFAFACCSLYNVHESVPTPWFVPDLFEQLYVGMFRCRSQLI